MAVLLFSNFDLWGAANFVRTTTGVTPRTFLADGGQRFFHCFAVKKDRNLRRGLVENIVTFVTQINCMPAGACLPPRGTPRQTAIYVNPEKTRGCLIKMQKS